MNPFNTIEDFVVDESFQEFVSKTSESSVLFWEDWIKKNPERKEDVEKAMELVQLLLNAKKKEVDVEKDKVFNEIWNKISGFSVPGRNRISNIPVWLRIAASVVILIGTALIGMQIGKVYRTGELTFQEIIVPVGEKSQIILADGSHVWINSGSRLKYPNQFGAESRNVYLTGEAFFEVSQNNGKPFIVNTKNSVVKVLGTSFNVKSYPEDSKTQTTVLKGLVSVRNLKSQQTYLVRPSQMLVIRDNTPKNYLKEDTTVWSVEIRRKVNVENVTCWKDQLLVFADEPFEDMALKMERWFNTEIIIKDSTLRHERYNGKFVHNENVFQVLEIIKLTTPINYKIINNKIVIDRKK